MPWFLWCQREITGALSSDTTSGNWSCSRAAIGSTFLHHAANWEQRPGAQRAGISRGRRRAPLPAPRWPIWTGHFPDHVLHQLPEALSLHRFQNKGQPNPKDEERALCYLGQVRRGRHFKMRQSLGSVISWKHNIFFSILWVESEETIFIWAYFSPRNS